MKDKIKKILGTIISILIIAFALLWYPWFTSVEDGKTTCHNVFNFKMSCR